MPCVHPKKGFPFGITRNGKVRIKIVPYNIEAIDKNGEPIPEYIGHDPEAMTSYYEIPCGKCIGCRMDQAKEWSDRLIMEMQYHDTAYFVTLTYDELHMKRVPHVNELTGEVDYEKGTLSKRDVQLFIKRLRKAKPDDEIKYFLQGEYGPKTDRPHYHAIIYGLHLGRWSLIESGRSETGNIYYTCGELESLWQNGFISIEPANEFTCKYVCNYVTKKIGADPAARYLAEGREAPFQLSSRKPAIGRRYYDEKGEALVEKEYDFIGTIDGSVKLSPPRYFKKLYRESHDDSYDKIVGKHLKIKEDKEDARSSITDLSKVEQLKIKERELKNKEKNRIDL